MVIEINLDSLEEMGLTPNEFVFLTMINQGADETDLVKKLDIDLELLQTNGWIKVWEGKTVIRDKFTGKTSSDFDRMWHDLLSRYPLKVNANGGVRPLRAKDPDSKANEKSKARYQKVVKSDIIKHNYIMQCLERELAIRRRSNSLGFMQMLDTWINNHSWEKYSDLSESDSKSTEGGRITRQL
jgi:hypothetical protein